MNKHHSFDSYTIRSKLSLIKAAIWLSLAAQSPTAQLLSKANLVQRPETVFLGPGDDVKSIVASHAGGTKYQFSPGIYRLLQIRPKNNDVYASSGQVTLSGATVLSKFNRSGRLWYVDGQMQKGQTNGSCSHDHEECTHPEDLYVDDVPLTHVGLLSAVRSGTWFFDYDNARIYFADDPSGHIIETSVARSAFSGSASNVTISGLVIEKYAIPAQMGAIGDQTPGAGWIVNGNEVRLNHGLGIKAGPEAKIEHNWVHQNGQMGVGGSGAGITIAGNTIAFNNYAGFNPGWEAGGQKISESTNLIVRDNTCHDNAGSGLWTDTNNVNTLYEGNTSYNNSGPGIQHEISGSAIIRNNVAFNNGSGQSVWMWGAQILIQNSANVEVYGNRVFVPNSFGNGIGIIFQNRGSGPNGVYRSSDNYVHDNDVTYQGLVQGVSGMVVDYIPEQAYSWPNRFDSNHYHVINAKAPHWSWRGNQTWAGFRSQDQEAHGTVDTRMPPPIKIATSDR